MIVFSNGFGEYSYGINRRTVMKKASRIPQLRDNSKGTHSETSMRRQTDMNDMLVIVYN